MHHFLHLENLRPCEFTSVKFRMLDPKNVGNDYYTDIRCTINLDIAGIELYIYNLKFATRKQIKYNLCLFLQAPRLSTFQNTLLEPHILLLLLLLLLLFHTTIFKYVYSLDINLFYNLNNTYSRIQLKYK